MMKNHEGTRLGYNAQAVADSKAGVIVAEEVTTEQNDSSQLVPMLESVQTEVGKVAEETLADGGYFSGEQLDSAQKAQFPVLVNLGQEQKAEAEGGPYHKSKFRYDRERDCYICPMGQELEYKGIRKYKDKSYEMRVYHCKNAAQCQVRWECSKDKKGRCVHRNPYSEAILRQKEKQKDKTKADLLRKRMFIVEPAFARVKHLLEFRRWTMGGLHKAKYQWAFVCAIVNLSRIYPAWKMGKLQLV